MKIMHIALLCILPFALGAAQLDDRPVGFASIPIASGDYKAENGTVGGGNTLPVVATDVRSLALLLADDEPRVVLIANDIDLSWPSETQDAPPNVDLLNQPNVDGLPNGTAPMTHPFFVKDGRVVRVPSSIKVGSNKTIYSVDGKVLRHGGFVVRSKGNVIIRNIRFADLWEWDDITYPLWDRNTWDFVRLEEGAHHIWVDHCTFQHSYDGYVDLVRRTDFVTISYCKYDTDPLVDQLASTSWFQGEFDTSWIGQQYNELVRLKVPSFLNDPTVKGKDLNSFETKKAFVAKWGRHWKNTLIGNSNTRTFDRTHLNTTIHHNWWHHGISRTPRARFGNIHMFNNLIENIDNGTMTGFEASLLVQNSFFINGKKMFYGDEGVGRALGNLYVGPDGPKGHNAPFIDCDGELDGNLKTETVGWGKERDGNWHAVGDWWKIDASKPMEDGLPYQYVLTNTEDVLKEVYRNSGAGKIKLPGEVRKLTAKENYLLNCAACHGLNGNSRTTVVGVRWEMRDYTNPEHQKLFTDEQAIKVVTEGVARDALYRMNGYKDRLSKDDISELVDYVRTLK